MVFPKFDLAGQVALVTGAARGLGRAISLALANAGADVALGLRDKNAQGEWQLRSETWVGRPYPCKWMSDAWIRSFRPWRTP